jgi:hypothetical protein
VATSTQRWNGFRSGKKELQISNGWMFFIPLCVMIIICSSSSSSWRSSTF